MTHRINSADRFTEENAFCRHYANAKLLTSIMTGLEALGRTPETITLDELAPLDEFHVGGREATRSLLNPLNINPDDHALDIGCGLGGTARFIAQTYGCRVSGIDLTPDFIHTGQRLTRWLGLNDRVQLHLGDALAMPFEKNSFDLCILLHVGMNIDDKSHLFEKIAQVLRPGKTLLIYDLMRINDGSLTFPMPWASSENISFVTTSDVYQQSLKQAGFRIVAINNHHAFALDFFRDLQEKMAHIILPLGLHIVMGSSAAIKYQNLISAVQSNIVAPVEIRAEKI